MKKSLLNLILILYCLSSNAMTTNNIYAHFPINDTIDVYEKLGKKILQKNGWINNRNSVTKRGISVYLKGVYSTKDNIAFLMEFNNNTNIAYDIESLVFISSIKNQQKSLLDEGEKPYSYYYTNLPDSFDIKSKTKVVFVFDKFTISDNKRLEMIMNEIDGERTLTLPISSKTILKAINSK